MENLLDFKFITDYCISVIWYMHRTYLASHVPFFLAYAEIMWHDHNLATVSFQHRVEGSIISSDMDS